MYGKISLIRFIKSLSIYGKIILTISFIVYLVGLITIFKFLFIGKPITYTTPVGDYTCRGGLIKVCTGSKEVADYLGV